MSGKVGITVYDRLINRLTERSIKQTQSLKALWAAKHDLKYRYEEAINLLASEDTIGKEIGDKALSIIAKGDPMALFEAGLFPFTYGWKCQHSQNDAMCSDCSKALVNRLVGIVTGLDLILTSIADMYLDQTGNDLYDL